ncbi:ADP-ribosylglycohydrolase family protein [Solihabitans fulvus]|uniref:ADP-ribosylglycohydrolase family protein n=1 Tax=Solihabitans fulvus TaxID=1892852 RepID=A0A5B2XGR8_9PSEU|nr:ADP-ribosylglycohydrolase family protein [Solihabitans fulvus]KAA2263018.1 ADP-ribosylglycohydrolase family protein [Solihabitans fulvus]
MTDTLNERDRLTLAYNALAGLSVGDALGAQFFVPGRSRQELAEGNPPPGPWEWTDDTEMACTVVTELRDNSSIRQDALAALFADRCEPYRGYGPGAVVILHQIRDGMPWRDAAGAVFGGQGSCGNGAAMRVAPLGAYHAADPDRAADQAARSAEVTHLHPEGIAGAVAVAVAASVAASASRAEGRPAPEALLDEVTDRLPAGDVRQGVLRARALLGRTAAEAAYELGNGSRVTAQDTVPFTLWVAATHLADFPAAITTCVAAGGDIDTTSAIVGGIVASHTGIGDRPGTIGVPPTWLAAREPLPAWVVE